jgi:hypothetical protein
MPSAPRHDGCCLRVFAKAVARAAQLNMDVDDVWIYPFGPVQLPRPDVEHSGPGTDASDRIPNKIAITGQRDDPSSSDRRSARLAGASHALLRATSRLPAMFATPLGRSTEHRAVIALTSTCKHPESRVVGADQPRTPLDPRLRCDIKGSLGRPSAVPVTVSTFPSWLPSSTARVDCPSIRWGSRRGHATYDRGSRSSTRLGSPWARSSPPSRSQPGHRTKRQIRIAVQSTTRRHSNLAAST